MNQYSAVYGMKGEANVLCWLKLEKVEKIMVDYMGAEQMPYKTLAPHVIDATSKVQR